MKILSLIGVLLACIPPESSDMNQFDLRVGLVDHLGLDSHRVLLGTAFSLSVEGVTGGGALESSCVTSSTMGVVSKVGDEFSIDAAGSGAIEFMPNDGCPEVADLGPDRWSAIGVEPGDATALWIGAGDSMVLDHRLSPGPAGVFPDVIGRPLAHTRVAAVGRFVLLPTLVDQSAGERAEIRWRDSDGVLVVPPAYRLLTMQIEDDMVEYRNFLNGRLLASGPFTSSLEILGKEFQLPQVEVVRLDEIAELQLVPVYLPSDKPEREWGPPVGIVAVVLDGGDQRIMGAPLEWSLTRGDLYTVDAGYPDTFFPVLSFGDDTIVLADCGGKPTAPELRSATVRATIAGHVAFAEFEWLALPSDYDELDPDNTRCRSNLADNGSPDGRSEDGCNCSARATPRDGFFVAGLPLLALLAGMRRRLT
jgi:MYXO-CTERM domain-containing protein